MGVASEPIDRVAGGDAAAHDPGSGGEGAAPSAEEYRTAAILALGLLLKVGLLAGLVGLLARGCRAGWRRLRRGRRR